MVVIFNKRALCPFILIFKYQKFMLMKHIRKTEANPPGEQPADPDKPVKPQPIDPPRNVPPVKEPPEPAA